MELPEDIRQAPSLSEAATRLGALLELDTPPSDEATHRAINDPQFARALFAAKKNPKVISQIIAAANSMKISPDAGAAPTPTPETPSTAALLKKAAGAALKWGMEGLEHARPWDIERRVAACNACEFQAPAPKKLVYRGAEVLTGKDAKICTKCHCLTNTKAAMATERCPEKDPQNPQNSRWGEPWEEPSDTPGPVWQTQTPGQDDTKG